MQTRYIAGGSAAYDLNKFQSKPRVRIRKPSLVVAQPSQSARAKARARDRVMAVIKTTAVVVILVAVVVTMLYSRAVLTEVSQKISAAATELEEAKSEGTRLSAELESKVSLRNVEEYATQVLGMSALNKQQVTYVDMGKGDQIELTAASPKLTIFDRIRLAVSNVQEYIPNS